MKKITPAIEKLAKSSKGGLSTGGMTTKLQAAKKCAAAGITMVIADGKDPSVIKSIVAGEPRGTVFLPCNNKLTDHEIWKLMHGNASK